jgi:hypothetical protein
MEVETGGVERSVPEKLTNRLQIGARLEQVSREGVTKRVAGDRFFDSGDLVGIAEGLLDTAGLETPTEAST